MQRSGFEVPARRALHIIAIVSFIISVLWFLADPGFEPVLAFLGGAAVLIGSFIDRDQSGDHPDSTGVSADQTTELDHQEQDSPEIPGKKPAQRSSRKIDLYQTVEDALYFDAFTPAKALLWVILWFSLFIIGILPILAIAGADGAIFSFAGFIWLASVSGISTLMVKNLYRRISLTGFYGRIKLVDNRERVKDALLKREWGNFMMNISMRVLISLLLKTDKREVNKIKRQLEL